MVAKDFMGDRPARSRALMVLNLILFTAVLASVWDKKEYVAHFTFPSTRREIVPFNFSEAGLALDTWINTTTHPTPLSSLHRLTVEANAMDAAGCDAGMLEPITTPACDCVEGVLHARLLAFVGGNASRAAELDALSLADVRAIASNSSLYGTPPGMAECARLARPTQSEVLVDRNGIATVNVAVGVLTWCAVSTLASVFSSDSFGDKGWGGWRAPHAFLAVAVAVLSIVCVFVTGQDVGNLAKGLAVPPIVVQLVMSIFFIYFDSAPKYDNNKPIQRSTMLSVCFGVGAWVSWTTMNAVSQRRDYNYHVATTSLVVAMAVFTYVIRFVDHGIANYNKSDPDVTHLYTRLFSITWVANIAIAALLVSMPGTSFEAGPLSNTATVATGVVVLMFIYPALLSPLVKVKAKEDKADTEGGDETEGYNNQMYEAIDVLARLVLGVAVSLDLVMIETGSVEAAGAVH